MKPAIFLDRDGVLNKEKSYITSLEQLEIFSYTKRCINGLHKMGYLAIVISNQSAIARGMMTENGLENIHGYMKKELLLDAIYYCPHYYQEGKMTEYNIKCHCRKPETGMIEQAIKDFSIDLNHSYFVGDRATDIQTGKNMGIKTVLLKSGYKQWQEALVLEPDLVCDDLISFTKNLQYWNESTT